MTVWIWDRFAEVASEQGSRVAIRQGDEQIGFDDLLAACESVAGGMTLLPGDRAVIYGSNNIAFVVLVGAIWRRGAIPVLLNAESPVSHLAHAAARTEAAAIYVEDPTCEPDLPLQSLPDINISVAPSTSLPPHGRDAQDHASIVFTSGSSGPPKGVTQRAETLIDGARRVSVTLDYKPLDSILCPIPFTFDYGWGHLLSMMTQGVGLVLPEQRNAFSLCEALAAHQPTVFAGVPAVFADLLNGLSPIGETERTSIRLITNTGSRIPDHVFQQITEVFPSADLSLNYGLTETYRSSSLPVSMTREKPGSVGYALEDVTISVLRKDGSPAQPEEEGEIIHAGAGVFDRYWNDPEGTSRIRIELTLETGEVVWGVRTGDFGRIGEDGLLYVHGRRDRQVKCMGVRVALDEVEEKLYESGILREVAVTASSHDMLGTLITAHCVVADDTADEKKVLRQLKRHARETMSNYMQPRAYKIHPALPRNPNGKIDYPLLGNPA